MLASSSTCLFSGVCVALLAVALAYYFYWTAVLSEGPCGRP
uniref:Predicted gene, 56820 n=2 Tax=Murinae TaxID=39107 RepID=A0A6I8MWZ3_MOUSE